MNSRQKLVQQQFLNNEKQVLKRLKSIYTASLGDVTDKISNLEFDIDRLQFEYDWSQDGAEKAKIQSQIQSKIYQKQYQQAIQGQLDGILQKMHDNAFTSVSEYLSTCYDDGFIGAMYDLHGQGVPLIMPIDQEAMVRAVQTDSKISTTLYSKMGENVTKLKKDIAAKVSRGITSGMTFAQVAQQIRFKMVGTYDTNGGALARAMTIARTEGHRIQVQAGMDACYKAKDMGADVVKQWDSTLDGKTRDSHRRVDGEIHELDEEFSNGLMFPGDSKGKAAEVVNCRCALLQRARWALDKEELDTLKQRAEYYGLDKTENFTDFKKKYLKATENINNSSTIDGMEKGIIKVPVTSTDKNYTTVLTGLNNNKIEYRPVKDHSRNLTPEEIIQTIGGGDKTKGSCASLGLAYIGQRQGWNVLDFRDGDSREWFSGGMHLRTIANMQGLKTLTAQGASSMTVASNLLKQCAPGKEYFLSAGKHVSIVRKTSDGAFQYLELQTNDSGWRNFDKNIRYTLKHRFGCSRTSSYSSKVDFMIDIDDSDFKTNEFRSLLGFINTESDKQHKGVGGSAK